MTNPKNVNRTSIFEYHPRSLPLFAACLALLWSCSSPPSNSVLVEKLVSDESPDVFELQTLWTRQVVHDWMIGELLENKNWEVVGAEGTYAGPKGPVRFEPAGSNPMIKGPIDIDASEVHELRVDIGGVDPARGNRIAIYWASGEEPFSPEKMIQMPAQGPGRKSVVFDVASHPKWTGSIQRLRLDPTFLADDSIILRSIQAIRRSVDPNTTPDTLAKARRIDLNSDIRNGYVALPSTRLVFEVTPPRRSTLRFSYALDTAQPGAVGFQVNAIKDHGSRELLFEQQIQPRGPQTGRWQEARVELGDHAGQSVELEFTTTADSNFDPGAGFPYWADLELHKRGARPTSPNIVLIVIDTLRADHVSSYGYQHSTTPGLDAWVAQQGVRFENAVAPSPWTLPSHVSLFTGLDAVRHGINHPQSVPKTTEMLAETLAANGYRTVAFSGGGYVSSAYGLDRGFDRFDYWMDPERLAKGVGKDLDDGLANVHEWLDRGPPEPFFLFFHTYEVHATYLPREPHFQNFLKKGVQVDPGLLMGVHPDPSASEDGWRFRAHFTKRSIEPELRWAAAKEEDYSLLNALYDSGIAYTDRGITELIEAFQEKGLDDRTLIIVTSDHGEGLGEKSTAGHYNLYDFNLLIPLMMSLPDGQGAGLSVPTQVRLIDVYSSILDVAGITVPGPPRGTSLVPLIAGKSADFPKTALSYAASSNFGISVRLDNHSKLILNNTAWGFPQKQNEFYDLSNDPQELESLGMVREATRLGKALKKRYESSGSFVRIDFSNEQSTDLGFRIGGSGITQYRFKSLDSSGHQTTSWKPGQATVVLQPGSQTTLFVELPLTELILHADSTSAPILIDRIKLSELRTEKQWGVIQNGNWIETDISDNGTWIRVGLQSSNGTIEALEGTPPEEIQNQLRQLGYIN